MNRATLLVIIPAILSLAIFLTPVHADISYTGQLDPADPADWNDSTDGYIGRTTDGTLTVNNGSELKCKSGLIGYDSGVNGSVMVNGTNSYLYIGGELLSGVYGNGDLNIRDGAHVFTRQGATIGCIDDSVGIVTLEGENSSWRNYGELNVGNLGSGELRISHGAVVESLQSIGPDFSLGTLSGSKGVVTVEGDGSKLTIENQGFYIGRNGESFLCICDGGSVTSEFSSMASGSELTSVAIIDGNNTKWTNEGFIFICSSNFVEYDRGDGNISISGGGCLSTGWMSLGNKALVKIDVGNGSLLHVIDDAGTPPGDLFDDGKLVNDGIIRINAGAEALTANKHSPISAAYWEGEGVYQAVGGTWDNAEHEFTVSAVVSGDASEEFSVFLNTNQRALIADDGEGGTEWTLGASFLHKTGTETELLVTATAVDGDALADLQTLINTNADVLGAWNIELAGEGYAEDDPVYLSFAVGEGYKRGDLLVWHFDGSEWTAFDAMDLTVNDGWASFTATEFSGYAVSTVPEPGTLILLLAAGLGLLVFRRVGRGRMNFGGAAQTNQP